MVSHSLVTDQRGRQRKSQTRRTGGGTEGTFVLREVQIVSVFLTPPISTQWPWAAVRHTRSVCGRDGLFDPSERSERGERDAPAAQVTP